jgi:NADH-quinone oxidoreductase subunit F
MTSVGEFRALRHRVLNDRGSEPAVPRLVISAGTCGQASGANDLIRITKRQIVERNLQERIALKITGCQGYCEMDPCIVVEPGNHLYPKLTMDDVPRIIDAALEGKVVENLLYRDPKDGRRHRSQDDIPFFKGQTRTLLAKNQKVDPIRIMDYIEVGGYAAFEKVVANPTPELIIAEVTRSGLRGRGGAGFPTGRKWALARAVGDETTEKYVVCNADEGDPGAYMDRSLLEGNPHSVLEGMIIAGIAIGARQGFVYVRSEYPLAAKHVLIAIRQARDLGILGKNILGTGLDFDVAVVRGAGAFVCGEETALIKSIEGLPGEPRQRPPYPIERGIWGKPTCINNVETLANIPVILRDGGDAFAKVGIPGNTGTKIFSLVGKIANTGLVEVPLGMKLRDVVYEIGGGPVGNAKIKAVQTGGPSGGCIPASRFDLPIDYDRLAEAGTIMGSGGMIVMDEHTCMVDIAKYFTGFLKGESCGKCFTCRKGTQRMYEILDDISKGRGTLEQLALLEELAEVVKDTTMCGLGQTASNPVQSTLRYFRDEYLEHIEHKRCPAGVCKDLVGAPCQAACPLGTESWRYIALLQRGDYEGAYRVIRAENPFPSVCARVCNHPCEDRCRAGAGGGEPVAVRALKRFVTDRVSADSIPRAQARVAADAVVGSGPAGLSAAHYLALRGYRVTVFEADDRPGGMLVSGIPPYRLPREVLDKEIAALLGDSVTLRCGTALGRDVTIDGLLEGGFKAVYLAMGAHRSKPLGLGNDDAEGVFPAMKFLKAALLEGRSLAKGRVGVIGGGNSAVDAARVALRQPGVESVTIYYRRTRKEMPAFEEEVEAALAEGVKLEALVSPTSIEVAGGKLTALGLVGNELGPYDASGRRSPVPVDGSKRKVGLDTLIAAIGEDPETEPLGSAGIQVSKSKTVVADRHTFATSRAGVFAGGDVVTGPNTVVDAIAAGKKAAAVIDRFVRGEALSPPAQVRLPSAYLEALEAARPDSPVPRAHPPAIALDKRTKGFAEVELSLTLEDARTECSRCLRCDLEFTRPATVSEAAAVMKGDAA